MVQADKKHLKGVIQAHQEQLMLPLGKDWNLSKAREPVPRWNSSDCSAAANIPASMCATAIKTVGRNLWSWLFWQDCGEKSLWSRLFWHRPSVQTEVTWYCWWIRSYAKSRPLNYYCQQRTAPSTQMGPSETTSKYVGQQITLETHEMHWSVPFSSYFLHCKSHFLLGSSRTCEVSLQQAEKLVEELPKLGRDKSTEFGFFNKFKPSAESATSCLIEQLLTTPDHVVTRRMAAGWTGWHLWWTWEKEQNNQLAFKLICSLKEQQQLCTMHLIFPVSSHLLITQTRRSKVSVRTYVTST